MTELDLWAFKRFDRIYRVFKDIHLAKFKTHPNANKIILNSLGFFLKFEILIKMEPDIRWEQRFSNYVKALTKLEQAVNYINHNYRAKDAPIDSDHITDVMEEILIEGLIQRFEYTHELAWNVMKDYVAYQGNFTIGGSRDATREAFQFNLFQNGHIWMDMISSRNKSTHTYNEATAKEIYTKILNEYYPAFLEFRKSMEEKISGKHPNVFDRE